MPPQAVVPLVPWCEVGKMIASVLRRDPASALRVPDDLTRNSRGLAHRKGLSLGVSHGSQLDPEDGPTCRSKEIYQQKQSRIHAVRDDAGDDCSSCWFFECCRVDGGDMIAAWIPLLVDTSSAHKDCCDENCSRPATC